MSEASQASPGKARASWWLPVALAIAVAFALGIFGGTLVSSFSGALFGGQEETALEDAGNVDRRTDRLAGEGPLPISFQQPIEPVGEPVSAVVETTEPADDTRAEERRILAYDSPLTPPVTAITERIRQRKEERQAAVLAQRPADPTGADTASGVLAAPVAGAPVGAGVPVGAVRYGLYRGSVIPAVLESAIDSNLPGLVRARVSRDVYDSLTGTHVLIPRGARLIGTYGQGAGGGQGGGRQRLFVAWEEMRLPDGTPVELDDFAALGSDGASGIKARRATGFIEALGAAVLFDLAGNAAAILTAATGIGGAQRQGDTGALANAISGALGNSTQRVGADYVGSLLARSPRFRVKAGSFMNVIVEQDLMLPVGAGVPVAAGAPVATDANGRKAHR